MLARVSICVGAVILIALFPLQTQFCKGASIGIDPGASTINAGVNCLGFLWCYPGELKATQYKLFTVGFYR